MVIVLDYPYGHSLIENDPRRHPCDKLEAKGLSVYGCRISNWGKPGNQGDAISSSPTDDVFCTTGGHDDCFCDGQFLTYKNLNQSRPGS